MSDFQKLRPANRRLKRRSPTGTVQSKILLAVANAIVMIGISEVQLHDLVTPTSSLLTIPSLMNVEISRLGFAYPSGAPVLKDLSITINTGSTVAIVGPSGCGKTTLLRIVAGILGPLTGVVTWDGYTNNLLFRRTGKIGYMFQTPVLLPHLNIAQNVTLPFTSAPLSAKNGRATVDLLHKMGLSRFASFLPEQLSVGMRARVALARTLITSPDLLLLDEPFSALDIGWRLALYQEWLSETTQRVITTILVTHDVAEAFLLSSRIIVLSSHGHVIDSVECPGKKPAIMTLDSVRTFFRCTADKIEEIQYKISRDVIGARSETLQ
jgi:NitT/TauT family transport system ATP-binding protein